MSIVCATHSSYPRVGEGPGGQRLRQAYGQRERGEIDQAGFERIQDDVAAEVLAEQSAAGVDIVTDGLVRWYDPISHVAGGLEGVEIAGLVRWFDTNFYVRQAIVRQRPRWKTPYLAKDVQRSVTTGARVKAILTGPLTLASYSIDPNKIGFEDLVDGYATALRSELEAILRAGAVEVQIDEPSALFRADLPLLRASLGKLVPEGANVSLATYFGDAEPIYDRLQEMPVSGLTFDLTYSKRLLGRIASEGSRKRLGLGAVDGRNTALEDVKKVSTSLAPVIKKLSGEVVLTTSCGIEHLPRDRARRKTEHLRTVARSLA